MCWGLLRPSQPWREGEGEARAHTDKYGLETIVAVQKNDHLHKDIAVTRLPTSVEEAGYNTTLWTVMETWGCHETVRNTKGGILP